MGESLSSGKQSTEVTEERFERGSRGCHRLSGGHLWWTLDVAWGGAPWVCVLDEVGVAVAVGVEVMSLSGNTCLPDNVTPTTYL